MSKSKAKLAVRETSKRTPRLRRLTAPTFKKNDCYHCRLNTPIIQPTLRVGAANDRFEKEAEKTADRIVAMPSPEIVPQVADSSPSADGSSGIGLTQRAGMDDQPNTDTLEVTPPIPADHQDPEVPKEENVDTTGLTADDMKEIESGEPEDTAGESQAEAPAPPSEDEPAAQPARSKDAAVVGDEGGPAPADIAGRVSQPGSGRPLPASVRAFMEPRFGKDFSDVRIHDGPDDRRAARRIGAHAFTHRRHIWIGPDESVDNRRLMAHELTHVVQQTRRKPAPVLKREVDLTQEAGEPEVRRGYIRNKAEKYARKIPGYRLVSVILGKSPITGDRVERNGTNLLGALMAMIPGGGVLFDRLMETRVIQTAFEWVKGRLHSLNITWTRIKGLISELIDYLPAWPSNAIRKAKSLFAPIVRDILTFIGEVKDKILEFIIRGALKLAGPLAEKIWGVIQKAGSIISKILKDPLAFAKNLFSAVLKGFRQFGSNIFKHIKKGLLGWLFGAVQGLDIQIPEKLDFKGIISIGLQIVGLTYAVFRKKLVKRLGASGERKVAFLEKSVEVVKILVKEGFVGLWQRVLQMIDNFKKTMIGGIQKFVIQSLIMGGLGWLAGLSNPVGAVVKVVLAIYNIIKTFLERLDQILEVANSIFSSIGAIAAGKIQQAADFIEKTIAATIPVVISFLAALVPITGITNSIRSIIKNLKKPVAKAMDKMIGFLVKKAKKLFSKLIGKLNKKRKLPSASFKVGKKQHRIFAEKKGNQVQVMVDSKPIPIEQSEVETKAEEKKLEGPEAKKIGKVISQGVEESDGQTEKSEKKIKLNSKNQNQLKNIAGLKKEIEAAAKRIEASAKGAEENPEIDTQPGGNTPLFRAKEPRDPKVEGRSGTYKEMRDIVKASQNKTKRSGGSFYEVDHIVEKHIPKAILENLRKLDPKKSTRAKMTIYRTSARKQKSQQTSVAEKQTKDAVNFGEIGKKKYASIADDAPQFPAIILYRPNHIDAGKLGSTEVGGWIQTASESADPQNTMKRLLRTQLTKERDNVAKAYQKDKSATAEIAKNINEGLQLMQTRNSDLYGLGGAKGEAVADAKQMDLAAESKSDLTFDSQDSAKPDFDSIEGKYDAHSSLPDGFGKYLEKDHIVEKSYPLRAKDLTFAIDPIWAQISGAAAKIDDSLVAAKLKATRMAKLRNEEIYASGDVVAYTEASGKAMLMYRPIHRAVSSASPGVDSTADLLPNENIPAISSAAQAYLISEDNAELNKIRRAIKPGIQRKVGAATDAHARKVESEYDREIKNVRAANAEGGAEAQAMAAAEMQKVINKVKSNLRQARTYSVNLFS
jgi:hypothetical protein